MTYPPQQPGPYQPGPYQQPAGGYGPPQQPAPPQGGWYGGPGYPGQYPTGGPPPRRSRTGLVVGIVVALVVVLGGGTGAYFLFFHGGPDKGQAAAPTASASKPASANGASLGNLSTLDPCSLIETKDFAGTAEDFPYSFTACLAFVTAARSDVVTDVTVEFADTWDLTKVDPTAYSVRKQGAVTVVAPTNRSSTSSCYDDVFFTRTNVVLVDAVPDSGNADGGKSENSATLCGAADTASRDVAAAINSHTTTHLTYGAQSMGGFHACSALDAQTVRQTIGGTGTSDSGLGDHSCRWGGGNDPQPTVTFGTSLYTAPETSSGTPGAVDQTVTGRPTLFVPDGADQTGTLFSCRADTVEHSWSPWPGKMSPTDSGPPKIIEYASMDVTAKGDQNAACVAAEKLAGVAWPKLPPPS